ncbi:MAG: DNA polymerase III subunit delta [Prevotellaceae bacterium]|jgi:DNA polymerase-3 subunit delta|nr:DNA polymerase III subunit delta [Prevotellaceae bacterium]
MAKKEGITYEQIMNDLHAKSFKPVYFLMGDEGYFIDQISDFFEKELLSETERDFNLTVLYGLETNTRDIIYAAKRFPMMSEYQVIIIKEAQNIKKEWERLSLYLQQPAKSTILVFCYKHGTPPDKRVQWFVDMKKTGLVFESVKVRDYEIGTWIKNYIRSKQLTIDEKSVALLAEYLGTDLSKIVNELDKLVITLPAGTNAITAEQIEKNIGISKDFNVFELQAALMQKNALQANRIVQHFVANGKDNSIQTVVSNLFGFFSNVLIYHYLPANIKLSGNESFNDKRAKSAEIGRELGVPPYPVAENIASTARKYSAWKCMTILTFLREIDARSKGLNNHTTNDADLYKELISNILY